jgi:catechol 2,3-dioxygenase-like lactoylglutathione lyase family enzyme
MNPVRRLSRVDLISADPERLAAFYEALGFTRSPSVRSHPEEDMRMALRLGEQRIDLLRPSRMGAPYPPAVPGWSLWFQHCAIVVSDMGRAFAKLQTQTGWTAISMDGPQRLPQSSGGVTAFKFQDPEGHPLELIAFPRGYAPDQWRRAHGGAVFLGIDHSAISVSDTDSSTDFYKQLGLSRTGGSMNIGAEQARLDGLRDAEVEVTALSPRRHATPHVELLRYRGDFIRDTAPLSPIDVAATRLVFEVETGSGQGTSSLVRDPDGHLFILQGAEPFPG